MVSARHCFKDSVTTWCNRHGKVLFNEGSQAGECKRVIAADRRHDIALFEVSLRANAGSHGSLRLASYAPAQGTRLVMIGYPADADPSNPRRGKITVTDNCWVLRTNVASPHYEYGDISAVHNCSTYGGNSGGPMIREGSRDVVGCLSPTDLTTTDVGGPTMSATRSTWPKWATSSRFTARSWSRLGS